MDEERHERQRTGSSVSRISSVDTVEDDMKDPPSGTLLPGICDHITVAEIATKLSWKDFHVLSCVSRAWRHAIRSRLVYEARIRSQTRETLVLCNFLKENPQKNPPEFALFSMRDRSFHRLPSFPPLLLEGIPPWKGPISLDGKVYVLGGENRDVHVLDLAGQMHWKQCAKTKKQGKGFQYAPIKGKIYAVSQDDGEVYDPKKNTWSPIRPMPMRRRCLDPKVATLGDVLAFYDSYIYDSLINFLVYHPVQDEWREGQYNGREIGRHEKEPHLVIVKGKLYLISVTDIHVYDANKTSWCELHTLSYQLAPIGAVASVNQLILSVVAVEDELLACMWDFNFGFTRLFQSKGFRGNKKEILWEETPIDPSLPNFYECKDIFFVSTIIEL